MNRMRSWKYAWVSPNCVPNSCRYEMSLYLVSDLFRNPINILCVLRFSVIVIEILLISFNIHILCIFTKTYINCSWFCWHVTKLAMLAHVAGNWHCACHLQQLLILSYHHCHKNKNSIAIRGKQKQADLPLRACYPAMTRIRTWVFAATTRSTNHYTIMAILSAGKGQKIPVYNKLAP